MVNMDLSAATLFLADAPFAQLDDTQHVLDKAPKRKVLECDGLLNFLVWRTYFNCYSVAVLTACRLSASTLRDELSESRRS